ncbi:hypothetical protein [Kitasatospora sp. NPDC059571]|uniref:hypothetical protein n=1 Tax=Kitasatospora sp. NPDC059571 TaxID=3346871 RepID=UPI0036A9C90F
MATNQKFSQFRVNRTLLITGAAMSGFGAVLALTGTVIVVTTLASAGRSWAQQMETPPSAMAAKAMQQAKAASLAGLEAWRTESRAASSN